MIRHKLSLKMRNQLSGLAMECDSCAAIEGARMTERERETLQNKLWDAVKWIDERIAVK